MNSQLFTRLVGVLALVASAALGEAAHAQLAEQIWTGGAGAPLDWNGSTWSPIAAPPSVSNSQIGVINNGGAAFLSTSASANAAGVQLGRDNGSGALEIRNGGSLTVSKAAGTTAPANGAILVGNVGTADAGTLSVLPGGSLTTDYLDMRFVDSSVNFGGTTSGTTNFTNHGPTLVSSNLRLTGPNVNFSTNSYQMGGQGVLTAGITGPTHSAINVATTALLGGRVNLEFNGYSPTVGDSWTLINAGGIGGSFASPNVSNNASLNPGEAFVIDSGPSQVNVSLERVLSLSVDLNSGAMSINNNSTIPLGFDAYSIRSNGLFSVPGWNSLASNGYPAFQESNASPNQLGELNPNSSAVFASGNVQPIGAPLNLAAVPFNGPAFDPSSMVFDYRRDSDGKRINGIVDLVGEVRQNALVLSIDPSTGDAVITNDSYQTIALDSYSIASASNSLLTSWDSLEQQGGNAWQEASPTTGRLSELLPTGDLSLDPLGTIELDGLWNTAGVQDVADLDFQFRETGQGLGKLAGIVEFLGGGLTADFDNDNDVDGADLAKWQGAYGVNGTADSDGNGASDGLDFLAWQRQFTGAPPATAQANAVPEPAAGLLLLSSIAAAACIRRCN